MLGLNLGVSRASGMAVKLLSDSDAQGKSQPSGQPLIESQALVHPHQMPQPQDHSAPHGVKRLADITTHPSLILLLLLRLRPLGIQSQSCRWGASRAPALSTELSLPRFFSLQRTLPCLHTHWPAHCIRTQDSRVPALVLPALAARPWRRSYSLVRVLAYTGQHTV